MREILVKKYGYSVRSDLPILMGVGLPSLGKLQDRFDTMNNPFWTTCTEYEDFCASLSPEERKQLNIDIKGNDLACKPKVMPEPKPVEVDVCVTCPFKPWSNECLTDRAIGLGVCRKARLEPSKISEYECDARKEVK
jgi:hypothetical protein